MVTVKIYIEGGGEGKDLDSRFREAWTKFFKAAGLSGKMPRPVRGKGRSNTFDLFTTALRNSGPEEIPLLLIDSEEAVEAGRTAWQHLKSKDGWDKPKSVTDAHVYLMVQVMETWLIADVEALARYFGREFKPEKIPVWTNLEEIAKPAIFDALEKATSDCKGKRYKKGKISFEVLSCISPEQVATKCPNAQRLLDFLKSSN